MATSTDTKSSTMFTCYYCHTKYTEFAEAITHTVREHQSKVLKVKIQQIEQNKTKQFTKNFTVVPNQLKKDNKVVIPNNERLTIKISRPKISPSPVKPKKRIKLHSTPKRLDFLTAGDTTYLEDGESSELEQSFMNISLNDDQKNEISEEEECQADLKCANDEMETLTSLLPVVIENLKECGQLDSYIKFNKLVSEDRMPLSNIAYLLFLDVVEWYSLQDTRNMRYSENIKWFWKIGLKLFKGKFLRFMSGMKNKGQDLESGDNFDPMLSSINFAVPNRTCLDDSGVSKELRDVQPGIMLDMIKLVNDDGALEQSYKVSFDGKKVNSGIDSSVMGDINLWGYEGPPTLSERRSDYDRSIEKVMELENDVLQCEARDLACLTQAPNEIKERILIRAKDIIHILSERLRDLRNVKRKKLISLEKINQMCVSENEKKKYMFAISAVKTYIYRLDACFKTALRLIDSMSYIISVMNNVGYLYCTGNVCDLGKQANYQCLTGIDGPLTEQAESLDTKLVGQRTAIWHKIRAEARVTGSTCYDAIGLAGLKKQKQHMDSVFNSKPKPPPTEEVEILMKHGSDNEINGVATLVSKVLPVFMPNFSFLEEGCHRKFENNQVMLLVSPDGLVKENNTNMPDHTTSQYALEIKCPYPPQNVFKPAVQYNIPFYYVPQILCEMYVLGKTSLIFICYSQETTVVIEADFDNNLWQDIWTSIVQMYDEKVSSQKKPPKPPIDRKHFETKLKEYTTTKTRFLVEVPSVIAKECDHDKVSCTGVGLNTHQNEQYTCDKKVNPLELQSILFEVKDVLNDSFNLTRSLASEVVVYLLADLDRIHKPERQHAIPIAYAMKGYSMTTTTARQMVDDVLDKCYEGGIYVPVISFDGQWFKIAVRSANDDPLTLLQLMKDVFLKAKSTKKSDIVRIIKETNVVEALSQEDVLSVCQVDLNLAENGHISGPVYMFRAKNCKNLFHTTSSVLVALQKNQSKRKGDSQQEKESSDTNSTDTNTFNLLDELPSSVAQNMDDNTLARLDRHVTAFVSDTVDSNQIEMEVDGITELFTEGCISVTSEPIPCDTQIMTSPSGELGKTVESIEIMDESEPSTQFGEVEMKKMLTALQSTKRKKWNSYGIDGFKEALKSNETINDHFLKSELIVCLNAMSEVLERRQLKFGSSWKKEKIVDFMHKIVTGLPTVSYKGRKQKRRLYSLKHLCAMEVSRFTKDALNVAYAEYLYPEEERVWRNTMSFTTPTFIEGIDMHIEWYSKPEYVGKRYMHLFSMLDCHHLFTNARSKCCSTGISQAGIKKNAWFKVAREHSTNGTGLSLALVEDLVDKQSNAYAQKTFSAPVEEAMRKNGDVIEANFCKLIREWYQAEDDPGLNSIERCRRRLQFRDWLMDQIDIGRFPPPGSHINGIPIVMFEGLMTNIERRIQLFPYVKKGSYNVRACGSLENENFFGEFQDLDPKGSGVLRPADIPMAISTACELTRARFDPNRPFFMHTSRSKVYHAHQLEETSNDSEASMYMTPVSIDSILPRDHVFDMKERGGRKHPKRKSGEISKPALSCKGERPVRQHHRCEESKILPHIRLGLDEMDLK